MKARRSRASASGRRRTCRRSTTPRVDRLEYVSQADAEEMTRRLAREEGIFAGISSGGAMHVTLRIAKELKNAVIVTIICDRGDRYLSRVFLTKNKWGQINITARCASLVSLTPFIHDAHPRLRHRDHPGLCRHPQDPTSPMNLPDRDVAEVAFQKRRVQSGGANDFLPVHLQRVVVISCVLRSDESLRIFSIGEPEAGEGGGDPALLRGHQQVRAAARDGTGAASICRCW